MINKFTAYNGGAYIIGLPVIARGAGVAIVPMLSQWRHSVTVSLAPMIGDRWILRRCEKSFPGMKSSWLHSIRAQELQAVATNIINQFDFNRQFRRVLTVRYSRWQRLQTSVKCSFGPIGITFCMGQFGQIHCSRICVEINPNCFCNYFSTMHHIKHQAFIRFIPFRWYVGFVSILFIERAIEAMTVKAITLSFIWPITMMI